MSATEKILWVVNYADLAAFLQQAVDVGVTGVAIRTDNDVGAAIPVFHGKNMAVYGWRWPSTVPDHAMTEARNAVGLIGKGLDGYFVDPELHTGHSDDWNQPGLAPLADSFCKTITDAKPGIVFGTTSHYRGKDVYPDIPWSVFFGYSTVLLPQAYWRSGTTPIGHGPTANYTTALDCWTRTGGDRSKIVPMSGELTSVTGPEIDAYAAAASAASVTRLHFYTYEGGVSDQVWDAVRRA
ncbi:MAG TPA: hypothetical protein VLX67_09600 [Stellaceae bacterium]|nr:hypothetical protein [Stellaceae bacterium]